jgi:hypothetical protein
MTARVPKNKRKCKLCGEEFQPNSSRQIYCKNVHKGSCPDCGKEVIILEPKQGAKACKECRILKAESTMIEKYGSPCGYQSKNVMKGVIRNCEWCGKEFSPRTSNHKYCDDKHYTRCKVCDSWVEVINHAYPPDHCSKECDRESAKRTSLELYGVENGAAAPEAVAKMLETNLRNHGGVHSSQTREYHLKVADTRNRSIASDGTKLDSSYEVLFYNYMLRLGKSIDRAIPIEYMYKGELKVTIIDFKVDDILFEVKGGQLLSGCFDHVTTPIAEKLDVYKQNNVILITDTMCIDMFGKPNSLKSNGLKYQHKCPNPLIGINIELFRDPQFPYREDRPKCFYDVKVAGDISVFEAFNDEKIRWDMIVNRIQYSGGFIDSNQILTALNVTRTCKQPSWFSKSFAKGIIQKYITSGVIVDPFAGWGTRADAANELHKNYIGVDINLELVKWHQLKQRNIIIGDAKEFKYDGICSVFICPPYQDIELYSEDQDISLTQCQWLELVMQNIPNAKEYIMVCKVVDSGWEKYIVETKPNKSHFGTNNEYVLLVTK